MTAENLKGMQLPPLAADIVSGCNKNHFTFQTTLPPQNLQRKLFISETKVEALYIHAIILGMKSGMF